MQGPNFYDDNEDDNGVEDNDAHDGDDVGDDDSGAVFNAPVTPPAVATKAPKKAKAKKAVKKATPKKAAKKATPKAKVAKKPAKAKAVKKAKAKVIPNPFGRPARPLKSKTMRVSVFFDAATQAVAKRCGISVQEVCDRLVAAISKTPLIDQKPINKAAKKKAA